MEKLIEIGERIKNMARPQGTTILKGCLEVWRDGEYCGITISRQMLPKKYGNYSRIVLEKSFFGLWRVDFFYMDLNLATYVDILEGVLK